SVRIDKSFDYIMHVPVAFQGLFDKHGIFIGAIDQYTVHLFIRHPAGQNQIHRLGEETKSNKHGGSNKEIDEESHHQYIVFALDEAPSKDQHDDQESNRKSKGRCKNTKQDRKSTRLNSSHVKNSYAVFCLK